MIASLIKIGGFLMFSEDYGIKKEKKALLWSGTDDLNACGFYFFHVILVFKSTFGDQYIKLI